MTSARDTDEQDLLVSQAPPPSGSTPGKRSVWQLILTRGGGPLLHCQSLCELPSLKTMKSVCLDVSSDISSSPFLFFPLRLPPLLYTESLSTSCWATSLWEADTMADARLSTPRSHAFTEIPRSSGNKTPLCCSSDELGSVRGEHPIGFRAPHRYSLLSLFSVQMLLSGVAVPHLCPSCHSPLCILFLVSLQHHLHLWLAVSACLLIPLPSVYPKLPVLLSVWSLLPGL